VVWCVRGVCVVYACSGNSERVLCGCYVSYEDYTSKLSVLLPSHQPSTHEYYAFVCVGGGGLCVFVYIYRTYRICIYYIYVDIVCLEAS
jgi:hypothetical protein